MSKNHKNKKWGNLWGRVLFFVNLFEVDFRIDFLGGFFGGVVSTYVGHPFDTVKVRLQVITFFKLNLGQKKGLRVYSDSIKA